MFLQIIKALKPKTTKDKVEADDVEMQIAEIYTHINIVLAKLVKRAVTAAVKKAADEPVTVYRDSQPKRPPRGGTLTSEC